MLHLIGTSKRLVLKIKEKSQMEIEKEKVIEIIKEAKSKYGLTYSKLARELQIQPASISLFITGKGNIAKEKQIKILCYIDNYVKEVKAQINQLEHLGICIK